MKYLYSSIKSIHHKWHLIFTKLFPLLLLLLSLLSVDVFSQSISDTITLPPPSNLGWSYHENYKVLLTWEAPVEETNDQNRDLGELIAYHVYLYEEMIGSTPADIFEFETETYDGGGYSFYVTAIYGDPSPGESSKTGPVSVSIPGTAIVSCSISDPQGPIMGVKVSVGPYSVITTPNNPASFELREGTYTFLFEKTGYYPSSHSIYLSQGSIIALDVTIFENLLPPQDFHINFNESHCQWLPPELDQEVVFNETFDLNYQLDRWQQDQITNNLNWATSTGSPSGIPGTSHSGLSNTSLFGNPGASRLISPQILLTDSEKSQIHFWYSLPGANMGDRLQVVYKTEPSGIWHLLADIQDSISDWQDTVLTIPGKPETCFLGFKGIITENSPGICLDDISVIKSILSATYKTRGFRQYKIYLDGILIDSTYNTTYFIPFTIGETYVVGAKAEYFSGTSEMVTDTLTYYTCDYFNPVFDFNAIVYGRSVRLTWWDPGWGVLGYQILRNNTPIHDGLISQQVYWDTPWPCGRYSYNIISVYDTGYSCPFSDPEIVTTYSEFHKPLLFQNDTIISDTVFLSWSPPGTQLNESIGIMENMAGVSSNGLNNNSPNTPIKKEIISNPSKGTFITKNIEPGTGKESVFTPASSDSLFGYQIYKNTVKHAFISPDLTVYKEHIPFPGTWEYYISAVYENGESCEDGPVLVEVFPGQISGTVLDKKDLDPIYEAEITLSPGPYTTETDIYGVFNIEEIPAGVYNLNVEEEDYHSEVIFGLRVSQQDTNIVSVKLSRDNVYLIPFEETWDSGSFVDQSWLFGPTLGNWSIDETIGNPVPSAKFSGMPNLSNFEYSLISPLIDISSAFNNLELSFDLRMEIVNPDIAGSVSVDILNDDEWIGLMDTLIDQMSWRSFSFYLSKHDLPDITQFRITLSGEESEDFEYILFDNIAFKQADQALLQGIVTELATGTPVEGAEIVVDPYQAVYTDASGLFVMSVDEGYHQFSAQKIGYNPYIIDTLLVEEFVHLNIELTQPVFNVDPDEILQTTAWWPSSRIVTLTNDGNGPLSWQSNLIYIDENKTEMDSIFSDQRMDWDLGFVYDVTTSSGGTVSQAGVEFDGTYFYTTIWDESEILKYDRDGTHIGTYTISGASNIRDLAYDGEYLYGGAASTTIYQIDPETFEVVNQFGSPENVRAIAYDIDYDAFWVCDWSTDFYLVGRDGVMVDVIVNPGIESVYGMACDREYVSNNSLWLFHQGGSGADLVEVNINSGELTGESHNVLLDISAQGNPIAGGAYIGIDDTYGVYLGGMIQADFNLIFGYEIGTGGWLTYYPTEGTILPNESMELTLNFAAIDTLHEWEFVFADILFIHEPIIDTFVLHILYTQGENIDETDLNNIITIFPNPTQNHLQVESKKEILHLKIYDHSGKLISNYQNINQNNIPINTQSYPSGLYVLEAILEGGVMVSEKVIIFK